jgi:CRP-like cAMP-binding protein
MRPRSPDHELLRKLAYFRSLPPRELDGLVAACRPRLLKPGAVLFEEGQPCLGLCIVAEGSVKLVQVSFRGREQVFHAEGPGATLGEGPLFDGGGYIATAIAVTPTRALFLSRAYVLGLCRRRPEVALAMLEAVAGRLRRFAEMIGDLAFLSVVERLARYLEALSGGRPAVEVRLPLTQAELAARLGTVRELVARAFVRLEKTGVISRQRSIVVVLDPRRLAALSRGEDLR